jgi:hypothetical protein
MAITDVLVIVALILAAVEELQARGQALLGWAVILVCIALLWHLT